MPNGRWFKGKNYSNKISSGDKEIVIPEKYESYKEGKFWYGIWIEDNSGPWIFENIEIFVEDKKYSQVFCKQECRQAYDVSIGNWIKKDDPGKVEQMIEQIKSSNGKWSDAEKICKVGNKRKRSVNTEQLKNLRLFCSKSKNSLIEKTD